MQQKRTEKERQRRESMKKICVYGKGGIGKSTTVANVAAAMAQSGLKVAVIGCDPKADTTRCLTGRRIPTVLQQLGKLENAEIVVEGYRGIRCIESGGPGAWNRLCRQRNRFGTSRDSGAFRFGWNRCGAV